MTARLITLAERGPRDCCWPMGEPMQGGVQLFCGQPVRGRSSYCPAHNPHLAKPLKPIGLGGQSRSRRARPVEPAESDLDLMEMLA